MRLATASPAHARSIAEIYREAFPESIELFFPRKPRERLLRLLALSFALLFGRGAKGAVALDEDGRMAGYLLYSTSRGQARGSLPQAVSLLARMALGLGPVEMLKLMTNQLLMMITVRKAKKVPKPQAAILSVAVLPAYQGQGVGTLLLDHALKELQGQSVGLNVRANNAAGKRLYAAAGFEECGSRRDLGGKWLILYRPPVS